MGGGDLHDLLRIIGDIVVQSPWLGIRAQIPLFGSGARVIASAIFVQKEQDDKTKKILTRALYLTGVPDSVAALRDRIQNEYRPAVFDHAWFTSTHKATGGSIAEFRKAPNRRKKVSSVGATFFTGRSIYSQSPERCRTFDSEFQQSLSHGLRSNEDLGRFRLRSMYTVPLYGRSGGDNVIAVLAVCRGIRDGFPLEDRQLLTAISRQIGPALEKSFKD